MNLEHIDEELAAIHARSPWDQERGEIAETNMSAADQARRSELVLQRGQIVSNELAEAMHRERLEAQGERERAAAAHLFNQIISAIEGNPALAERLCAALGVVTIKKE